jgi:hypothetical protein
VTPTASAGLRSEPLDHEKDSDISMTLSRRHRPLYRPLHRVLPARTILLLAALVVIIAGLAATVRI